MKYKAFISYSHSADEALAPALQSALHAFARPWTRMRALHIFRDQTSVAASPELWPSIEAALEQSEYLLLLASPASAASRWVGREIEWWFEHRSPQTMLILLTDGELVWDEATSDFDWSQTSSLPGALMSHRFANEPLWVDLRWSKSVAALSLRHDRFRRAVLDIAAPLHGKDKDELDGDDVRQFARLQRIRRVVIAGLTALTIVAVAAAVVAVRQRNEANRQNAAAQAGRLAAQADLLREQGGATDASVMLAAEGLRILSSTGQRSLEVDLSLRRALAGMPFQIASLDVTAHETRLTPAADRLFIDRAAGNGVAVLQLPGGELRSCSTREVDAIRTASQAIGGTEISTVSTNGDWCIVQRHAELRGSSAKREVLELWAATPLRFVDRLEVQSKEGWLEPAISDDGNVIALTDPAASRQVSQSTLRLWSRSAGADLLRLEGVEFRGFSPDHRHFATSDGLWRLATDASRQPQRVITWPVMPSHLVFSSSGAYVAARTSYEGDMELWDVNAGQRLVTATPPAGEILALRDDGRFILVKDAKGTLLADTENGVVHAMVPLTAETAAFGKGGATLILEDTGPTGLTTRRVLVLPAFGGAFAGTEVPFGAQVHHIGLGDDHADLLATTGDGLRVLRWTFANGTWATLLSLAAPEALAVSVGGEYFAASIGRYVAVGRTDGGQSPMEIGQPAAATRVALSRDGRYLATFSDGAMHVWKLGTSGHWSMPMAMRPEAMHVTSDGIFGIALIVDEAAASRSGPLQTLVRWRLAAPDDAVSVSLGRALHPFSSTCMVSDDGRSVRAGGVKRDFAPTSNPLSVTADDLSECAVGMPTPLRLATSGMQVVVSDPHTGQALARLDHPTDVRVSGVSADARRVATVDEIGHVRVFAIDPVELIAQACARAPRPLSGEQWGQFILNAALRTDACGRDRPQPEGKDEP